MDLKKIKLKQIIKEELRLLLASAEDNPTEHVNDDVWDAHKVAIANIRQMSTQMSDEDSYVFLTLLKDWFNTNVLEEQ